MAKLSWFQRLSTREVVGTVTDVQYAARGIAHENVTLYDVMGQDSVVHRGAILGHQSIPRVGDRVEMYLEKGRSLVRSETQTQRTRPDGSVEVVPQLMVWEPIKSYRVLEEAV